MANNIEAAMAATHHYDQPMPPPDLHPSGTDTSAPLPEPSLADLAERMFRRP